MANANFSCALNVWVSGTTIYAQMHYWRSGTYHYYDSSFPNPTMTIDGTVFYDTGFGDRVRSSIYVGDVYTTTYSKTVSTNGTYSVSFWAGSGQRSDFAGTWYGSATVTEAYSRPTGISGANLDIGNNTNDGWLYSRVDVGYWGDNSSSNWWIVAKYDGGSSWTDEWTQSQSTNYLWWHPGDGSTSTGNGVVYTWYPEADNNHDYRTYGGVKYVASPSAPVTTATGSTTDPSLTISGKVLYKGGDQNSQYCTNGTIKYWRFHYKRSDASSYNNLDPHYTSDTTFIYPTLSKETFDTGYNYNIVTRVRNTLGACGSNWQTVYCPTGVYGSTSAKTPKSLTLLPAANYAGTLGNSTGGTMAQYVIKYSTDEATVTGGGGTETAVISAGDTVEIDDLTPGTTYYYRVYGWNTLGLSQVSSTLSETTVARYYPESAALECTPTGTGGKTMGGKVKITIVHTGGLTVDELPVTSLEVQTRPTVYGLKRWTTRATATDLSLTAGDSYTFDQAWEGVLGEGNHEVRVLISNGTDQDYSPVTALAAPTGITVTRYREDDDCPVQINVNANATVTNGAHHWRLLWQPLTTMFTYTKEFDLAESSVQLSTVNYLLYNTEYLVSADIFDDFGLWDRSNQLDITTDSRFSWSAIVNGTTKSATPIFAHNTGTASTNYSITDVYYVVKGSLGSVAVDDDLRHMRLNFITGTLNYRPESVASLKFANGKEIAYRYDASADMYKFGIWTNSTIETTFHDGEEWKMTSFVIPDEEGYTVESLTAPQLDDGTVIGMNASAPFSTTSLSVVHIWENE